MLFQRFDVKDFSRSGSWFLIGAGVSAVVSWLMQWRVVPQVPMGEPYRAIPATICACLMAMIACVALWLRFAKGQRYISSLAAPLTLLGLVLLFAGVNSVLATNADMALETKATVESMRHEVHFIHRLVQSVQKAESGQRGFLLTNSEEYLLAYQEGLAEIPQDFHALAEHPYGDHRVDRLRALVDEKTAELAATIRLKRSGKPSDALAIVRSGKGLKVMEGIEDESAQLTGSLRADLAQRLNQNQQSLALLGRSVAVSSAIATMMILAGSGFLTIEIRRRRRLETELREIGESIESKVEERTAEIREYSEELRDEVARRRLTASLLREASERLRVALDYAKVAVWTWYTAEDRTAWSGPVDKVFGMGSDQLTSFAAVRALILPEDRESVDLAVGKALREGGNFQTEFRFMMPDGGSRWIAGFGGVFLDEDGQPTKMAGVNFDISERKRMEEQLDLSKRHYRELAEAIPQIVWTANANGEFEYQNDRYHRVTGLPKQGLSFRDGPRVLHPDDFARWSAAWARSIQTGEPYNLEYRIRDAEKGEYRWHWGHAEPERDAEGNVTRWFGISTDIHERKVAELQLAASEQTLRRRELQLAMLFETGSMGDFTWHFAEEKIDAHPSIWALFGEPDGRGTGAVSWFTARYHPDDVKTMAVALREAMDGTRPLDAEYRVVWPDGTVRWLTSRGVAIPDEKGEPIMMHGFAMDITERKLAAAKIEESERHFHEMADALPQIVWRTTAKGEIDYCNARWHEYLGYDLAEMKGLGWRAIVHPDDLQGFTEARTRGRAGGQPFEFECRLKRQRDAAYRWHLARWVPYRNLQGKILHWFGAATDTHEQKTAKVELEREVLQRTSALQQLEVKEGQLLRSLAEKNLLLQEVHHRVKNNLQVISSLLRMQGELLKDQGAAQALKESHERVLCMALIHEQLYGSDEMGEIDFARYTQTLVDGLLRSYAGGANQVTCRLSTAPVSLVIDQAIPCGLILNELVTNALKHAYPLDQRGEITVELNERESGEVILCVSDRGVGLPEDLDWKKTDSMGLPIVDLLTQQLGGQLRVQSSAGTAFFVEFQKAGSKAKAASAA
jgi:PAS domain S-box-containing protein